MIGYSQVLFPNSPHIQVRLQSGLRRALRDFWTPRACNLGSPWKNSRWMSSRLLSILLVLTSFCLVHQLAWGLIAWKEDNEVLLEFPHTIELTICIKCLHWNVTALRKCYYQCGLSYLPNKEQKRASAFPLEIINRFQNIFYLQVLSSLKPTSSGKRPM